MSDFSRLNLKPVLKLVPCPHVHIIGDNYGMTCQDCGEAVAGYGYGGWFGSRLKPDQDCIHHFINEICMYCERSEDGKLDDFSG